MDKRPLTWTNLHDELITSKSSRQTTGISLRLSSHGGGKTCHRQRRQQYQPYLWTYTRYICMYNSRFVYQTQSVSRIIFHAFQGGGQSRQVSVQQTEQCSYLSTYQSTMMVLHVAIWVPRTQSSNLSTYQSMTMVLHVAMSWPRTQCSNLSTCQSKNDGNIRGYVHTTNKTTRMKNTSNVDRSTKDHTCHMYKVHNMIQLRICQRASQLTICSTH
jgi:hypothetical protein